MIIAYITCKDDCQADTIAKALLDKKLIACANYFPIESVYRWKEEVQSEKEVALILKTTENHIDEIKKEVTILHSYDVPCIEFIDVKDVNEPYLQWVKESVND